MTPLTKPMKLPRGRTPNLHQKTMIQITPWEQLLGSLFVAAACFIILRDIFSIAPTDCGKTRRPPDPNKTTITDVEFLDEPGSNSPTKLLESPKRLLEKPPCKN